MSPTTVRIRVWDLPVRLFHWALVILLIVSWQTYKRDLMETHKLSGYTILTLVLFRILWGFVGSDSARFGRFLRSPAQALDHLRHIGRREPDTEPGHNPAGGWMVVILLGLVLAQATAGLFADDGILTRGPLARAVSGTVSDFATRAHGLIFNLIVAAGLLHIISVIAYRVLKGQDLIGPMITGRKRLPTALADRAPRLRPPGLALIVLALAAAAVFGVTRLG